MKILTFITMIICLIVGVVSILFTLTSVMLFDAPGSENNIYVWIMFWSAISLPIISFCSMILSAIYYFKYHNYQKSFYMSLLPCIPIATIGIAMAMLQLNCNGLLSC